MMQNTAKLLDEIAGLKGYKHQVGKALARIEHWHHNLGLGAEPSESREVEWKTLETILRIFKEEGVNK